MGKKLQRYLYFIHIQFLFFFFCLNVQNIQAQIVITDINPHEIIFTSGQTRIHDSSAEISLSDMNMLTGEGIFDGSSWTEFEESGNETSNYFIENLNGSVSVGRNLQETGSPYFSVTYRNKSDVDFDGLNVAFDFIYQRSSVQAEGQLYTLQSRVNNTDWKEVDGGVIHSSILSSGEEDWSSFSVQVHLDEIYIRSDDQIDIRWIGNPEMTATAKLPLALQRVEFSAVENTREPAEKGSLIITEILPQTTFDDKIIEYIEIYNPTEQPIFVKGLTLQSEAGEVVIQNNASIEPGAFFVVANKDAVRRNEVEADYTYTGTIIPSRRGVISLNSGEKELAKATYQTAEQGTALELNHAKHSFDGYSSLEDFEASVTELGAGVRGSPGESGATIKLFSKEVRQPGWYLFSLPGKLIPELNRQTSLRFLRTDGGPFASQDLSVAEPFLVYKEGSDPATLFTDEALETENSTFTTPLDNHSVISGFSYPYSFEAGQIMNGKNERAAPVVMAWDQTEQRFKLHFNETELLHGWEPVILNKSASEPLHIDTTGRSAGGPRLTRYLQFRLFEENRNRKLLLDDAAVLGFLPISTGQQVRYDLPKLLPLRSEERKKIPRALIYLSSSEHNQRSTSFSHLPHEPEEPYDIRLGQFISGGSGNFTLDWGQLNDIPDEWVMTLEDTYTGNTVDMMEQTFYSFRSAGGDEMDVTEENTFTSYKPDQSERFLITVEPYEDVFREPEESLQPEDVELRQNYPNPFNPSTTIEFYLPEEKAVRLGIYNVVGQQVAMLIDDTRNSGEHSVTWDASDMPSGIYIVQLELGSRMLTRKITLIK